MAIYFSEYFGIDRKTLEKHGAFDISLATDLPLFIDPFLLFNSKKPRYQELHNEIITYLTFLRNKAEKGEISPALVKAWYRFPEVKQTWLGFTESGNRGSGLGNTFAVALHQNLHNIFRDFGEEQLTKGSHLEKLCLIKNGVGRDNISDFTTNLIKGFLCEYTQKFAKQHISEELRKRIVVRDVRFNYQTESWEAFEYDLPWVEGDYVLLTPKDLLTKDDTWINKTDLVEDFERLPDAIPNQELRAQINNYFLRQLPRRRDDKEPTKQERRAAVVGTILQFPVLIDAFIRYKEDHGEQAENISNARVEFSENFYVWQLGALSSQLARETNFYQLRGDTYQEAHERIAYLKDIIEDKGGHKMFYVRGRPIQREEDVHIMYRLCWYGTPSDVSREVNDGRGPADFKISKGSLDKTIVEFKLAKNTQLKRNLAKQAAIYQKASDAQRAIKVIVYFSERELERVTNILKELKLVGHPDIVLIDARSDNKPSASKA